MAMAMRQPTPACDATLCEASRLGGDLGGQSNRVPPMRSQTEGGAGRLNAMRRLVRQQPFRIS
eukprot:CAMPEP_0204144144 /NCGR_PEP_ID=MMETSP0361-20130328/20903_1 /ASSEMBLY_ACC=CAM_ASM_000343 /TAXON_ID=268821 /ORGANISM="Scrippsiella Hangoei, Strain SHTV-5" /LENGTH=62 /DNA_ID=CAMNT_0051098083 /DNA_START=93 /DNA_END=277 /DNA_ORIENTATION=-